MPLVCRDAPIYFALDTSPAARLAHDVQLGNGEALTSDDAMTASDAPTAAHGDNGRSDGSGAKPTFSGGTNAGTTGAGTN